MSKFRLAYPKYKVFIFGHDVTKDVVSVNVNSHDGEAPNTCQITLTNEFDKYIITTEDMVQLAKTNVGKINIPWLTKTGLQNETTAAPDTGVYAPGDKQFYDKITAGNFDADKRDILLRKNKVASSISPDERQTPVGLPATDSTFANYYGSEVKRYPLGDGLPIFHPMDPVRVFMRDPYDPSRWYHHFCGFVSDTVDNTNENNMKTLTILVEDPTKLMRYSRIFINPGIVDHKVAIQLESDMQVQSFRQNFLQGLSLPEIYFMLMFGPDKVGIEKYTGNKISKTGKSNLSTRLRGIGHFSFNGSGILTFGPKQDPDTEIMHDASESRGGTNSSQQTSTRRSKMLDIKDPIDLSRIEHWQSLIDHEVQPSDAWSMLEDSIKERFGEQIKEQIDSGAISNAPDGKLDIEGVVNFIGQHPEYYMVDAGRLLMLIPNSLGTANTDIIINDIIQAYPLNSEWHSAGKIMWDVANRIQFSLYCTPKGDIILEPPLYDFDPDDFGLTAMSGDEFLEAMNHDKYNRNTSYFFTDNEVDATGDSCLEFIISAEDTFRSRDRGPYGQRYVVTKGDTISWESALIDSKVHTVGIGARPIFQNWESLPNMGLIGDLTVVKIPDLIPLYGIRQLNVQPRGYTHTQEGTHYYINTMLNRSNSDAHSMRVDHMPNIQLGINRPIYIQGRNCIATTKQISHSLVWSSDMSTTSDLYAIRVWDGTMSADDPTVPVFTPIGGYGSRPLNYAILFQKAKSVAARGSTANSTSVLGVSTADSSNNNTTNQQTPVLDNISPGISSTIFNSAGKIPRQ